MALRQRCAYRMNRRATQLLTIATLPKNVLDILDQAVAEGVDIEEMRKIGDLNTKLELAILLRRQRDAAGANVRAPSILPQRYAPGPLLNKRSNNLQEPAPDRDSTLSIDVAPEVARPTIADQRQTLPKGAHSSLIFTPNNSL